MSVAIIDYGSGNLRSAEKAVERCIVDLGLDMTVSVTSRPDEVARADHVILPGVGAFGDCIRGLRALDGMVDCLEQLVLQEGRPFLGICVGMQLLATEGHEYGVCNGLNWIPGQITPIAKTGPEIITGAPGDGGGDPQILKVPHMGWNQITIRPAQGDHGIFDGVENGDHLYFVHSYQFEARDPDHVMATTDYGTPITAMVGRDNILGVQFHPEKSQRVGLRLLGNFLQWRP